MRIDINRNYQSGYKRTFMRSFFPTLLAAGFFLASALTFVGYTADGRAQADRQLVKLFTVNRYQAPDAGSADHREERYRALFGDSLTEPGLSSVMELNLPYRLLIRNRPVDRTYTPGPELQEVETVPAEAEEEPGEPADVKKDGRDSPGTVRTYSYEIPVAIYYLRDGEAVQPVEEELYSGLIRLKKNGFLTWKLDEITGIRR